MRKNTREDIYKREEYKGRKIKNKGIQKKDSYFKIFKFQIK